jgi:hypothetical protein
VVGNQGLLLWSFARGVDRLVEKVAVATGMRFASGEATNMHLSSRKILCRSTETPMTALFR